MIVKVSNALLIVFLLSLAGSVAWSAQPPYPASATFTTLITTPLAIEGLTGDTSGNLYTVGRHANTPAELGLPCPVWKINIANKQVDIVGYIPAPNSTSVCAPSGLAFNKAGDLFVADGNRISYFTPNPANPPTASVYAIGVPGTNGLAFDRNGNLWTGDGITGLGRVWKITAPGASCAAADDCVEVFRIQPMRNSVPLGGKIGGDGVGRQARDFLPGTLSNNLGGQDLVANGLAFNTDGNLLVADTARGALWLVKFDKYGNLVSKLGCDDTFDPKTLCLENLFRADPRLEGVDGIALDTSGNIWASVNERNAIVYTVYYGTSSSVEVFRNPVNTSCPGPNCGLRNSSATDDTRILEFPTSPFLSGNKFCTANSDGNRRDNAPNTAGEVGGAGAPLGKISCMDQDLGTSGLPLPGQ